MYFVELQMEYLQTYQEYADAILDMNPKIAEKLFRDIAGDGGVNDTLKMFDIDPKNKLW